MEDIKRILQLSGLGLDPAEERELEASLSEMLSFVEVIRMFSPGEDPVLVSSGVPSRTFFSYRPSLNYKEDLFNIFLDKYDPDFESVAIKDNIMVKGLPCTAGSKMLSDHTASYDADCIKKLKAAGLKIAGKTNMDEFAMGGASLTGYKGPVINPFNSELIAGGSSGGSAAAVASGLNRWALGSDTGGSLRQPCSYMGLTGLKPTYGNVSRHGLIAYASSFDQIGPMASSPDDVLKLYDIITTGRYVQDIPDKTRLLVPDNLIEMSSDSDIIMRSVSLTGADSVFHFDMPYIEEFLACYYIIACAEASSNLGRYNSDRYMSRAEGFGFEVKKRICLGNFVLSHGFYDEYYMSAVRAAEHIKDLMYRLLRPGTILLMPVTYGAPSKVSDYLNDPLQKYKNDVFTVLSNITGLPSLTFPCAVRPDGSPAGVQLMGSRGSEHHLISVAKKAGGEE